MEQPTVKLAMLNRIWTNIIHRYKQRKFDHAVKVLQGFGVTPVQIVSVAGSNFIVGPDGMYYRINAKGERGSPHHEHKPVVSNSKIRRSKS